MFDPIFLSIIGALLMPTALLLLNDVRAAYRRAQVKRRRAQKAIERHSLEIIALDNHGGYSLAE